MGHVIAALLGYVCIHVHLPHMASRRFEDSGRRPHMSKAQARQQLRVLVSE